MTQHSTPKPDPLEPLPSATSVLRAQPDDAALEADFVALMAQFVSPDGGGLSPELSADLALEIVLNEVVEQACLATGATGAAIVLQRGEEMIYRACTGLTAQGLGSRLETTRGLSAECLRTRRTQHCDDVLEDPRVELVASQWLGVRSVMVMPLLRGDELIGVFELFSSAPHAFGERDELTLGALAGRILSNRERATQPRSAQSESRSISEELPESSPGQSESVPERQFDWGTWALGGAVFSCVVLLGVLVALHFVTQKSTVRPHSAVLSSTAGTGSGPANPPVDVTVPRKQEDASVTAPHSVSASASDPAVPPGGLLVFENGKEVFRLPPGQNQPTQNPDIQNRNQQNHAELASEEQGRGLQSASSLETDSVVELSPKAAEGSLLDRVEPEYPEDARQQQIQGAVVLDVHIGKDGAVQDVQVVSGPQQLVHAATDAVNRWRFRPRSENGHSVEMQTRITLNFRLP